MSANCCSQIKAKPFKSRQNYLPRVDTPDVYLCASVLCCFHCFRTGRVLTSMRFIGVLLMDRYSWLLNSLNFTNQPASYTLLLILSFFVFPLCIHTCLVRDLFLMLHCLEQSSLQRKVLKHTCIFQIIFEVSPLQAIL